MKESITIICFFVIGGLIGDGWMGRMINGDPSRVTVKLLAIGWGLIVAVCARYIIVSFSLGLLATVITYFVGAVVSGPARKNANPPESGPVHNIQLRIDDFYYKREVFTYGTVITYAITSVILFFVWG